jgi:hypothetical protein
MAPQPVAANNPEPAEPTGRRLWRENQKFFNRMRFDQHRAWNSNRAPELHSDIPSTWPALEAACRKWGPPVGFRPTWRAGTL